MSESIENLCEVIAPLQVEVWVSSEPMPFTRRREGNYRKLTVNESWGELFDCGWFRFSGFIPAGENMADLALRLDVNGELLVVDPQGKSLRGLTNVSSIFDRTIGTPEKIFMSLSELGIMGGDFEVWADAGCNDLFGSLQENGVLRFAELVKRPPEMVQDYFDARSAREIAEVGDINDGLPVVAVGHSHLDLAWLWPLRETHRKGIRTFASALANQAKYPWYRFGASQAQLYRWIENEAPELFAQVLEAEHAGRWELQGAMWVESDTHIPDGESLMRQFIYGQRYFREKFGHEVRNVWLPDVFGYSGSLPQIAKLNGADYVMTMKNAWNQFNRFPYNAFLWSGIDGSAVLTYRLPEGTYNGSANAASLAKCHHEDTERQIVGGSLMLFGIGDGGGGPGETHLELLARLTGDAKMPPVEHTASEFFFARMEKVRDRLPKQSGELYLENHQGTFTTCEVIKRINRNYECRRQELEFIAVNEGRELPAWYSEFEEEMLLMQFHDILPGTSIARVYDEAQIRHDDWMRKIDAWLGAPSPDYFCNPTSAPLRRFRSTPAASWEVLELAPFARGTYVPWQGDAVEAIGNTLTNGVVSITFAADGAVASWLDLPQKRELLREPANFTLYADKGNAWNIEAETYEQPPLSGLKLISQHVTANGPVGECVQCFQYGDSRLQAVFRLEAGNAYCQCHVTMDWHAPEHLMRFELPVTVDAESAQYATQFGFREYSTRTESPLDKARYEIAAQRWVRLEDTACALSLVTDCKYGFSIRHGRMNVTLLRAAERPGAFVAREDGARSGQSQYNDLGKHEFAFAFGVDHHNPTAAMELAEWLNRTVPSCPAESANCGVWQPWTHDGFAVSMVRPAWEGGGVLLRVYERLGHTGHFSGLPGMKLTPVRPDGRALEHQISATEFHAFEVKTFRIETIR